jgi:hypothetical protein
MFDSHRDWGLIILLLHSRILIKICKIMGNEAGRFFLKCQCINWNVFRIPRYFEAVENGKLWHYEKLQNVPSGKRHGYGEDGHLSSTHQVVGGRTAGATPSVIDSD